MNNRIYNLLFNMHTISGILISVLLYIIFFAGSFSFFKDDIANWEKGAPTKLKNKLHLNYDEVLKKLDKTYDLHARKITITQNNNDQDVRIRLKPSADSLASSKAKKATSLYVNSKTYEAKTYQESYNLGEFLYRFHFLSQIPYPVGYYLSGFTALFFLFAIITGVCIHWKKIISNFYVFRPKEKAKVWWTDAHTALGMIGLPFQFAYAVTGAFFMIKLLLVAPAVVFLYQGNQDKLYTDLAYNQPEFAYSPHQLNKAFSINDLVATTEKKWNHFNSTTVEIQNYNTANMHVIIEGETAYQKQFTGIGKVIYNVATNKIISEKNPYTQTDYVDRVKNILFRIHFQDYGGYSLKIISFILGITTCLVIISGVMIWLKARDKKNILPKEKRFNERVVRLCLAVCLSMYPVTALAFLLCKWFYPLSKEILYSIYFTSWLVLIVYFLIRKSNKHTTHICLVLGSCLGLLIPISNGIKSGHWFWASNAQAHFSSFFIDVFWLCLATVTLYASFKKNQKQ